MIHQPAPSEPKVVAPTGRLDASGAPRLRQEIATVLAQGTNRIVVNLSGVPYLSSSILRVLLTAHKNARQAGGGLVLCSLQPQVLRVIKTIGFDRIFAIYESEDEARHAVASMSQDATHEKERP